MILLLVPFLLVLLYFLKMRRQALQVPSTFLWRKSVEDVHVNSLFQWLRKNLLLLLQLACVLLLIFAVMAFKVFDSGGKHYILLIDSSASMSVADVEPKRLEAAKKLAFDEIARHTDADVGMVIEFNGSASVLQGYTSDRSLLRDAVRRIVPTQQPTRLEGALRQAESLANPPNSAEDAKVRPPDEIPGKDRAYVPPEGIRAEVHLYSDGCFSQAESEALGKFSTGNLDIHYHQVGRPGGDGSDNVGLVALSAKADPTNARRLRVSARVLNFRPEAVTVKVQLRSQVLGKPDFKLADYEVTLKGRGAPQDQTKPDRPDPLADFVLTAPADGEVMELHARLLDPRDDSPFRDQFPLDDQAWLLVGTVRKPQVFVVTTGNEALDWYFKMEKAVEAEFVNPSDEKYAEKYARALTDAATYLVIFDRCSPPPRRMGQGPVLPQASTFFIDQLPPPFTLSADEKRKLRVRGSPRILNPSHKHPLMKGLTGLDELVFTDTFRFELDPDKDKRLPPDVPRLLETEKEGAILFALPRGPYTDVVLTGPLVTDDGKFASTWPATPKFVLFMSNLLHTFGHVREAATDEIVRPGQATFEKLKPGLDEVTLLRPDGRAETEDSRKPKYERETGEFSYIADQVGVYRARWPGGELPFAVNLLDADESNIQPRDAIVVGVQRYSAVKSAPATVDTWKWGVLIALVLLGLEWVLYHRRFFS